MRATPSAVAMCGAALLGMLLSGGCGSNDTYNPTLAGGPSPDFTISVTPATRTVAWGLNTDYEVTLRSTGGFDSAVALSVSGLPSGIQGVFTPASVTPTTGGASSKLTVSTGAVAGVTRSSIPTGTHTLTITGTGGGRTHKVTATLEVTAAGDFELYVSPASRTVAPGQSTSYTVKAGALEGFSSPVTLSITGLPANTTSAFDPQSIVPVPGGASGRLDVVTEAPNGSSGAPLGSYTLTVTATGGGRTHSKTVTLVVQEGTGGLDGTIK